MEGGNHTSNLFLLVVDGSIKLGILNSMASNQIMEGYILTWRF
jgi:hypothetical protein